MLKIRGCVQALQHTLKKYQRNKLALNKNEDNLDLRKNKLANNSHSLPCEKF